MRQQQDPWQGQQDRRQQRSRQKKRWHPRQTTQSRDASNFSDEDEFDSFPEGRMGLRYSSEGQGGYRAGQGMRDEMGGSRPYQSRRYDPQRNEGRSYGSEERFGFGQGEEGGPNERDLPQRFQTQGRNEEFYPSSVSTYGNEHVAPGRMQQQFPWESREFDNRRGRYGMPLQQQQLQPERGRGPKSYQRSDERIYEEVCELLGEVDDLDASEITVIVQSGEVTLAGTVNSRPEKRMAEEVVESATGVKDIKNQLRISSAQTSQQNSSATSTSAGKAMPQSSGQTTRFGPASSTADENRKHGNLSDDSKKKSA